MQIESNDFFDFRYDSIRFEKNIYDSIRLEENVSKKTLNCDCKKMIISKDGMPMRFSNISVFLVVNLFEMGQFIDGQ